MLPIKKIYVDSRFKSNDSASHSDFKIDLPITLLMPDDTGFYIEDVCIPHAWFPIEKDYNDTIGFRYNGAFKTAVVESGSYTVNELGNQIVTAMNDAVGDNINPFESVYDNKTISITIKLKSTLTSEKTFNILTDKELSETPLANKSMNDLLKNFKNNVTYNSTNPFVSGLIDMNPVRNIYMTASGLGNFNTMVVTGERNVVKKIPVSAGFGEMIFDQGVTGLDHLDCSNQTLSRISFQFRDVIGRVLPLHDNHVSFSIVFSRVQNGN